MGGFPEHNLLVHGWNLLVDTVLQTAVWLLSPCLSGFQWILESEEIVNLHKGDFFFFQAQERQGEKKHSKTKLTQSLENKTGRDLTCI